MTVALKAGCNTYAITFQIPEVKDRFIRANGQIIEQFHVQKLVEI